jgi:catechol 2,3-dioxygenase-like lactoylglutathione lyase family enzyme
MTVKRIVTNIHSPDPAAAKRFYGDILGLEVLMDHGWVVTYGADTEMTVQITVAKEGGSGTDTPDISIEVEDVDDMHEKFKTAGFDISYGPVDEPWGVRRFYVTDPFGKVVNILAHI